jgi:hypothetical protein
LELGDFAVAAQPSTEHPDGVIAALGSPLRQDKPAEYLVRIDVASGKEISRTPLTPPSAFIITSTKTAIVLASAAEGGLLITWFDQEGRPTGLSKVLPGVGVEEDDPVRAFEWFDDDRLVIATGGSPRWTPSGWARESTTRLRLLDARGAELSSHACRGSLFAPGEAWLDRMGDQVVVTNLLSAEIGAEGRVRSPTGPRKPVCAFYLHGAPRWREVSLPDGELMATGGKVFYQSHEPEDEFRWHLLKENLRPGAVESVPDDHSPSCWGLTATPWRDVEMGESRVIRTESCCGDEPGGLFICRPPNDEDALPGQR